MVSPHMQIAYLMHMDKPFLLPLDGQRVLESALIKKEVTAVSRRHQHVSFPKYPGF